MGQTTELQVGKIEQPELGEKAARMTAPTGNGKTMKRWKKLLLIGLGAAVLIGLIIGGIVWSKRGVVTVQTGKVMKQDLTALVTASGQIKPPSENFASVNANSMGKITEIFVKEGEHVKKGQLLMRTEDVQQSADVQAQEAALKTQLADASASEAAVQSAAANLRTSQADLVQAEAKYQQSKNDFARTQELFKENLIAKQVFDQGRSDYDVAAAAVQSAQARVAQAKAQYQQSTYNSDMSGSRVAQNRAQLVRFTDVRNKTIYTSPLDGIVTSLPVHVGENVVPGIQNQVGSQLFQVSDLSVITAEVKVDETDIVNVKLNQPAEVLIDAIPNKTFKGHVTEIGQSAVSRSTGQTTSTSTTSTEEAKDFKVVVTLDDPPEGMRPGLSATAKITTATRKDAVTVPIQALTIRTRAELEQDQKKDIKGAAVAAEKPSGTSPSAKDKDKAKEELQGVFVIKNGRAEFATVETGIMGITDIEITKGIEAGQEIVTGSYQVLRTLKTNTKVKVDNSHGGPGDKNGPSSS
jgi:HlyD family secretion protein